MILVTVGTTLPFDDLTREVDRLAGNDFFREQVVFQIGHGTYEPQHGEFFKFRPNLDGLIEEASFVIGHGGTGTVLHLMKSHKAFLCVANPAGADDHQSEFLEVLERKCGIVWTQDVRRISELYERARRRPYTPLEMPRLAEAISRYLNEV